MGNRTKPAADMKARDILIVGAGLGGLAAALALAKDGHRVRVLESTTVFGEVGAGIRLPPNSTKLLARWGLDLKAIKYCRSQYYHFRRWKDGSTIRWIPMDKAEELFGAPYYHAHRADLHNELLKRAVEAGAVIQTGHKVISYDFDAPSVTTEKGDVFKAELILACDGIKSVARVQLFSEDIPPRDTGDVAYRILISGAKMLEIPELAPLIETPGATSWCGPDAHIVGYPIREGELYNIVVCATRQEGECDTDWIVPGNRSDLTRRFGSWDPRLNQLLDLAEEFHKWRLHDLMPLPYWVHSGRKVSLLGDSCHPTLPYLSQGAAAAFEDAACLARLLGEHQDLASALSKFEAIRLPRASIVQEKSREHQALLHVADGDFQVQRDRDMKLEADISPLFWGYSPRRKWLFGHDAGVADVFTPVGEMASLAKL